MTVTATPTGTGSAILPDVGTLSYNGVTWSSLQSTSVSGKAVKDDAKRTIKGVEWTLTVTGVATLNPGQTTLDTVFGAMRERLQTAGGQLSYTGKGFGPALVNQAGGQQRDLAWGPFPEVLEFTPLGASRSAMVTWRVTFMLWEPSLLSGGVMQFNEEITISYDDAGYSAIHIAGTLEIALTRRSVTDRTLSTTVDDFRQTYMQSIANGIDLTRFYIAKRNFHISRDRRTMTWDFAAEEQAPMGNPVGIPKARGDFTVRPKKTGPGMVQWLCTLNVTYTVAKGQPRRLGYMAFLSLLMFRMQQSRHGLLPNSVANQQPQGPPSFIDQANNATGGALALVGRFIGGRILREAEQQGQHNPARMSMLIDLSIKEGLHEDSKTDTYSATWWLTTSWQGLLVSTGVWNWLRGSQGGNLWKMSVENIAGWRGNLDNTIDPSQDVIVDLGGGGL